MRPVLNLFDPQARTLFGTAHVQAKEPPTFEALNLPNWLVLYEANLPTTETNKDQATLSAVPKDRVLIYLDGKFSGTLSRTHKAMNVPLKVHGAKEVKLLVENQGRVNFGDIDVQDFKVGSNNNFKNIK